MLEFKLDINTKPNIAKYSIAGTATLEGSSADIQKKLESNPKTNLPQILFTIYQHVFNSIYLLSSILDIPYPPPDLLHPMEEKIRILPTTPKPQSKSKQAASAKQKSTLEEPPEEIATTATETGAEEPESS